MKSARRKPAVPRAGPERFKWRGGASRPLPGRWQARRALGGSGLGQLQIEVVVGDLQGLLDIEGVAGKGTAQPESVDDGGQAASGGARLVTGQQPTELPAEIGIETQVVDALQAPQVGLVHAGGPEGQPGLHGRSADLGLVEVALDDGAQVGGGIVVRKHCPPFAYGLAQGIHQMPHGGFEQAVLVLEVVADDTVGDAGLAGDEGDTGVAHADFVDGFEGRGDELRAANGLHADLGHGHLLRGRKEPPRVTIFY